MRNRVEIQKSRYCPLRKKEELNSLNQMSGSDDAVTPLKDDAHCPSFVGVTLFVLLSRPPDKGLILLVITVLGRSQPTSGHRNVFVVCSLLLLTSILEESSSTSCFFKQIFKIFLPR